MVYEIIYLHPLTQIILPLIKTGDARKKPQQQRRIFSAFLMRPPVIQTSSLGLSWGSTPSHVCQWWDTGANTANYTTVCQLRESPLPYNAAPVGFGVNKSLKHLWGGVIRRVRSPSTDFRRRARQAWHVNVVWAHTCVLPQQTCRKPSHKQTIKLRTNQISGASFILEWFTDRRCAILCLQTCLKQASSAFALRVDWAWIICMLYILEGMWMYYGATDIWSVRTTQFSLPVHPHFLCPCPWFWCTRPSWGASHAGSTLWSRSHHHGLYPASPWLPWCHLQLFSPEEDIVTVQHELWARCAVFKCLHETTMHVVSVFDFSHLCFKFFKFLLQHIF